MRASLLSQFSYYPLIWMFPDRQVNNRVNHIHEKALRIAKNDTLSGFNTLLQKDSSVITHGLMMDPS